MNTDIAGRLDRIRREIEADPDVLSMEWLPPKPGYLARISVICRCCHTEEILNLRLSGGEA